MLILYIILSKTGKSIASYFFLNGNEMSDDFKGLKKLVQNAKKLDGQHDVQLGVIFNEGFIQSHTKFSSIDDLFEKAGFKVESKEDFDAIPQEDIDSFVRDNTNFEDFNEMYKSATTEYVKKQLFKGL